MKKNESNSKIIIYEGDGGKPKIEVQISGDTVWLSQAQIAEIFGVQRPAITKHIGNIFTEGELDEAAVWRMNTGLTATELKLHIPYFWL